MRISCNEKRCFFSSDNAGNVVLCYRHVSALENPIIRFYKISGVRNNDQSRRNNYLAARVNYINIVPYVVCCTLFVQSLRGFRSVRLFFFSDNLGKFY